ncbi:hypothetical protein HPB50_014581 [Hyalomma asiaticum]|uniref:Uncharacterized protein n=1 Tax=Hyalomma asiaticum TaxID=266040 RepID=A0ACB7S3M8_HYAAI|nr:hypothetical protein HPB50_014581 [Hyalomma asiaticum]
MACRGIGNDEISGGLGDQNKWFSPRAHEFKKITGRSLTVRPRRGGLANFSWVCGQNRPTQAESSHQVIRNNKRNMWMPISSRWAQFRKFMAFMVVRDVGWKAPEGKMAASAFQLCCYDPEAMAWTQIPTTEQGPQNSHKRCPGGYLAGWKLKRSHDARHGMQGQGIHEVETRPNSETHERARAISVLPLRDQSIIIVHTPDIEAADRIIGDLVVNTQNRQFLLQGYLRQDGANTCQGVIVVHSTDTTDTLQRVYWREGTIVEIRKFQTSNKARITFAGKEKPLWGRRSPRGCTRSPAAEHVRTLRTPRSASGGCAGPSRCVPRCFVCSGAHATNYRDSAAKFRTPKTAAQKGGKNRMAPKKKSRHPGLPRVHPRRNHPKPTSRHHYLEMLETGSRRRRAHRAPRKNERRRRVAGPRHGSLLLKTVIRACSTEQAEIAALKAQNQMLLRKIAALESKINQNPPSPSIPSTGVMNSELVTPNAATTIEAQFAAIENQISVMVPLCQNCEIISAMTPQEFANTSCTSRRPAGPYKDISGRSLKTSRRTTEAEDDDSCSLSGRDSTFESRHRESLHL